MNLFYNKLWSFIEYSVKFIIVKIFHLKLNENQWNNLFQFIKFGIVGLSNTLLSYLIYVCSLLLLQQLQFFSTIDYLIAQFIGYILSVLWSFYWNNRFVFQKKENETRNIWKSLLKTYISYAFTGLFLNSVLSILWIEVLHFSKIIAPIINLLISVPMNFVINKFWAFKTV